jgi:hypothetical protein
MKLVTPALYAALRTNYVARGEQLLQGIERFDPVPLLRLFNPIGPATWLATEIDEDGVLFGLADLGFGCPELGRFSLEALQSIRLPFGLRIERDRLFVGTHSLSVYARFATDAGSLLEAERRLREAAALKGER